jgi:hypothetical protein
MTRFLQQITVFFLLKLTEEIIVLATENLYSYIVRCLVTLLYHFSLAFVYPKIVKTLAKSKKSL